MCLHWITGKLFYYYRWVPVEVTKFDGKLFTMSLLGNVWLLSCLEFHSNWIYNLNRWSILWNRARFAIYCTFFTFGECNFPSYPTKKWICMKLQQGRGRDTEIRRYRRERERGGGGEKTCPEMKSTLWIAWLYWANSWGESDSKSFYCRKHRHKILLRLCCTGSRTSKININCNKVKKSINFHNIFSLRAILFAHLLHSMLVQYELNKLENTINKEKETYKVEKGIKRGQTLQTGYTYIKPNPSCNIRSPTDLKPYHPINSAIMIILCRFLLH